MARNVQREDFLVGRPPEMGQGDADVAGYLHGARAELWRQLRGQPLTVGGSCLSALWVGKPWEWGPPGEAPPSPAGLWAPRPGRPHEHLRGTATFSQFRVPWADIPLPFFLRLIPGLLSWSCCFVAG